MLFPPFIFVPSKRNSKVPKSKIFGKMTTNPHHSIEFMNVVIPHLLHTCQPCKPRNRINHYREANIQSNLRGTEANKLCFRLLGTHSKALLPNFALNMHEEWPRFHKPEKWNGFFLLLKMWKNVHLFLGSKKPENMSDSWKKGVVERYAVANISNAMIISWV